MSTKTIIRPRQSPAPVGPYNHAVRIGDLLFCSGQIPLDASGVLVSGDIRAQTERVLENVKAILTDQGLTFAHVVKATVFMTNLADFSIKAGIYSTEMKGGFEGMYQQNAKDTLGETGKETFEAVNFLKRVDPSQYKPDNGAVYPTSRLGRSLMQISQLIKAGVGLEVAFAEATGWDTHVNEGSSRGQLANLLRDMADSIAAFGKDLGQRMDDVVLITMSEFGRTARENGTRGTDHGHANSMFVLGNTVKGGKVYGDCRGLKNDKLYEGRDLDVTTDFRDVFAEASYKHIGNKDLAAIFPGYAASTTKFRGYLG
jgi:reactive intermediate/imine deaminase